VGFVQVIEYETDRADEIMALGEDQRSEMSETPEGFRVTVTRDRDNPNRYFTIVEFPSYEEAMANSARPETDAFASQLAALCTSAPRYYNLDVIATMP
jgi:quinol monooxygenase YgiN